VQIVEYCVCVPKLSYS